MNPNLLMAIILPVFFFNSDESPAGGNKTLKDGMVVSLNPFPSIGSIPVPDGFARMPLEEHSFGAWLRKLPLRSSTIVYLFNGMPKRNQQAQFAVLDITVGHQDLQQCADAVMRLRAEYLYKEKKCSEIRFEDNNHTVYSPTRCIERPQFEKFLEKVFARCGTASLEKQLTLLHSNAYLQPGDVLIRGGSPGHAMIIVDMAVNADGKKIYLLAQSYMPAQDIHIVKNTQNSSSNPWYHVSDGPVDTPEYWFPARHFRTWPR
jgi:hypothetical protein